MCDTKLSATKFPMIKITKARKNDFKKILSFYNECGYVGDTKKHNIILMAQKENIIVGVVRLCTEYNKLVLRGMFISDKYQKIGIGTQLLHATLKVIKNKDCYALPYTHLEKFYKQVGFEKIIPVNAPGFLQKRLQQYKDMGLKIMIMKRVGKAYKR